MQQQNADLKQQVETLNHVQAKLVAKNKRYREMQKSVIESQGFPANASADGTPNIVALS